MARGARYAAAMTVVTRRLPFGLSRVVAPSLLGYLLINLCTFFLDLAVLAVAHGVLKWPLPVYLAVTASNYLIFVLGLTDLLASAGVYFELARVIAAVCEAAYLYTMMRWVVFRDTLGAGKVDGEPDDRDSERIRAGR